MISLNGAQWQGKRSEAVPAFDLSVMIRRPAAEVFALLADIQDAEPLPRRATLRMEKDPSDPTAVGTRWHEAVRILRPRALLPWLPAVVAPRLRPPVAERLADIGALMESGA